MADQVFFYVGRTVHPLYREQFRAPPEGYAYIASHPGLVDSSVLKREVVMRGQRLSALRNAAELVALQFLALAGYVRRAGANPPTSARLVHSGQFLLRHPRLPYVVDFEDINAFCHYEPIAMRRPWARRRLLRAAADSACRFLLPWTDAARRGFLARMGEAGRSLQPKLMTVLPAVAARAERPRERRPGPLRVLFIGVEFFGKGGLEALRALELARQSVDVELDLVSFVPSAVRTTYAGRPEIRFHEGVSADALDALYRRADALIFPAHIDTLGFVAYEAMANALPVIASDHYALPEIVAEGESGLLFPRENSLFDEDFTMRFPFTLPRPTRFQRALEQPSDAYVESISERIVRLAEDRRLYERLSEGALLRVRHGPLSIMRRRERLGDLYRRALA